jgi:hypothetical protein
MFYKWPNRLNYATFGHFEYELSKGKPRRDGGESGNRETAKCAKLHEWEMGEKVESGKLKWERGKGKLKRQFF